jgi:hypothetical protein
MNVDSEDGTFSIEETVSVDARGGTGEVMF